MKGPFSVGIAAVLAGAMLVACGGDDNGATSSGNDAGPDVVTTPPVTDGSTPSTDGKAPVMDAGACNFATFVLGLTAVPANGTPSVDLGQACTDDKNQAEFQSLFP